MYNFKNVELLELVEGYAVENNLIDCEEMLSDRFDEQQLPLLLESWIAQDHVTAGDEFTDGPMLSESFSAWTDGLVEEGDLHAEQLQNYSYVGKYSEL